MRLGQWGWLSGQQCSIISGGFVILSAHLIYYALKVLVPCVHTEPKLVITVSVDSLAPDTVVVNV